MTANLVYSADFLLDIANSADCPRINREHDFGNQPFPAKDGWTVVIFYDAGGLDYIAHFISPNGEEIGFWIWPESEDRDRLIAWRGRPTPQESNNRPHGTRCLRTSGPYIVHTSIWRAGVA